jgi:hypothetical protein
MNELQMELDDFEVKNPIKSTKKKLRKKEKE